MSQQSELADYAYAKLDDGQLSAAHLVRLIREKWQALATPESVHFFVSESVRCLMGRVGVEVGDIIDGQFVRWDLELWDADETFESEVCALDTYLEDDTRYVFRKQKPA